MKVLVSGASGFIGSALAPALSLQGHQVVRLVRRLPRSADELTWSETRLQPADLAGIEAIIHLAGENIGQRWTSAAKQRIYQSRVRSTHWLAGLAAQMPQPPRVFITPSGINAYGSRGDEILTEESPLAPEGFLAELARDWEGASQAAAVAGVRCVQLRTGFVLSGHGGGLTRMLLPFRLGLGGRVGSGLQWMSWLALPDAVAAFLFALRQDKLSGPVNLVTPNPVTNAEFTRTLGKVLHRPAVLPVPGIALKLMLGEMSSLVLDSLRVLPSRLLAAGFTFHYPQLRQGLEAVLR